MEGLGSVTPFARLAAAALGDDNFTLLDVGCSSGIDAVWRVFGDQLRAFGFDPNLDDVKKLTAQETLPGVTYVPAFVGIPADDPGAARMKSGQFWGRMPWNRLSVPRTLQIRAAAVDAMNSGERTELNLWNEVPLADPLNPVIIPSFLRERGVDDVDFIKIDVDGADFLILRSLVPMLRDAKVLGVGIEVNFHGSDDPEIHTLHNVDRLMKQNGFELFSLSTRPYSMAALPAPYQLTIPAQGEWGRILQGDAIYFRDAAAPETAEWAQSAGPYKLVKLAALFSLAGLPDCAAEVLLHFRPSIEPVLDVQAGLDALTAQCIPQGEPVLTYAQYMAEFEADSDRFYPARRPVAPARPVPAATARQSNVEAEKLAAVNEAAALRQQIGSMQSSRSWRLTAPLRVWGNALRRALRISRSAP